MLIGDVRGNEQRDGDPADSGPSQSVAGDRVGGGAGSGPAGPAGSVGPGSCGECFVNLSPAASRGRRISGYSCLKYSSSFRSYCFFSCFLL